MPLRSYHAYANPPSRLDHTLAHPWEVGLAAFQILAGALGILAVLIARFTVSASFDALPKVTAVALCATLFVGGVCTLAGIYSDHEDLMVGYRRERLGLILSATAWLVYAGIVAFSFPRSAVGWGFGLILTTCGGLRLWATYREESRLRHPPDPDNAVAMPEGFVDALGDAAEAAQGVADAAEDVAEKARHSQAPKDP
jgi:hypothetical protein